MANNHKEFNKIMAFDELIQAMTVPQNTKPSDSIQSIITGQNFIQKIHDQAFEKGFEKGCEATEKVDKFNAQG